MTKIRPDVHRRFQRLLDRVAARLEVGEQFPIDPAPDLNEDLRPAVIESQDLDHSRWQWKGGSDRPVRRGTKTCTRCGRQGHTARTCSV